MTLTVINDPDGTPQKVNSENQAIVRAITETELEHASSIGNAYSWDSLELNLSANETFLFVKNL